MLMIMIFMLDISMALNCTVENTQGGSCVIYKLNTGDCTTEHQDVSTCITCNKILYTCLQDDLSSTCSDILMSGKLTLY